LIAMLIADYVLPWPRIGTARFTNEDFRVPGYTGVAIAGVAVTVKTYRRPHSFGDK